MKTGHAGLASDPEKFRTRWMRADRRAEYEKAAGEREARRAIARARPTLPTLANLHLPDRKNRNPVKRELGLAKRKEEKRGGPPWTSSSPNKGSFVEL